MVELQELFRDGTYHARRDLVSFKRSGCYGLPVRPENVGSRIVNPVGDCGEVPALDLRRRQAIESRCTAAFPVRLVVGHEEKLVLAVEDFRQPDGPAKREAVLVPLEWIF